ncbi:chemotaxis protein CheW [Paraburkholderia strydomiana]|uniref:chemotaxis protein CheW n=1 Tax=Paraburkholderia strydomiana TaxID=1245417 RepID=UPI0038BCF5B9
MSTTTKDSTSGTPQFLAFALGAEQYAVAILSVQEIRGYDAVTRIADAPEHIKGVINLRGQIIPIIDLRVRFGLENVTFTEQTVVVVLNVDRTIVGAVVDSVSDVVEICADDIKETPTLSTNLNSDHITGIATLEDRMLIMLDAASFLVGEHLMQSVA